MKKKGLEAREIHLKALKKGTSRRRDWKPEKLNIVLRKEFHFFGQLCEEVLFFDRVFRRNTLSCIKSSDRNNDTSCEDSALKKFSSA